MKRFVITMTLLVGGLAFGGLGGCGDSDEADRLGIGAECTTTDECAEDQTCLTNFKGGYCGVSACTSDNDCPGSSRCVAHTDQVNYCFRTCTTKDECNANRSVDNESNCSANITFVGTNQDGKACVPPNG